MFEALWERRVQTLLTDPNASRPGFRCTACGLLSLDAGTCVECGAKKSRSTTSIEEAARDAIDQSTLRCATGRTRP